MYSDLMIISRMSVGLGLLINIPYASTCLLTSSPSGILNHWPNNLQYTVLVSDKIIITKC